MEWMELEWVYHVIKILMIRLAISTQITMCDRQTDARTDIIATVKCHNVKQSKLNDLYAVAMVCRYRRQKMSKNGILSAGIGGRAQGPGE